MSQALAEVEVLEVGILVDDVETEEEINAKMYKALKHRDNKTVVELCRKMESGPLHVLTIHGDTVLHMAAHTGQPQLILKLLGLVEKEDSHKLISCTNNAGNTILHEAAAFNKLVPAAKKMLKLAPQLLTTCNHSNETPLFRAAGYGKIIMFSLLDKEATKMKPEVKERTSIFYQNDQTTILHMAIISGKFGMALRIARIYKFLVDEKDQHRMTALQHLARNSSAFVERGLLRRLIYKCVPKANRIPEDDEVLLGWTVPLVEEIREEFEQSQLALKLAEVLIKSDLSWRNTNTMDGPTDPSRKDIPRTPLFLATKTGCVAIVKMILEKYPQAIEHVDENGCTILHIAVKYRQLKVLDLVESMRTSIRKLRKKCDNNGNSILHMVAYDIHSEEKRQDHTIQTVGKMELEHIAPKTTHQIPSIELQQNLLLFKRVEKICARDFFNHVNGEGETAEQVFARKNEKLLTDAKEWMKNMAQNCSLISVLIATVAFAAAYTVPGGSSDVTGAPILLNRPLFLLFTLTDVLSLTFTLTSLVIFLSILTSPFGLTDFKQTLPNKVLMGFTCLILSVSMMMLSFSATIILMIRNKERWTKVALYAVAFLPVLVFLLSYMPLYGEVIEVTYRFMIVHILPILPRYVNFTCPSIQSCWNHARPSSKPSQLD